jgi:hypothetical protein
MTKDQLLVFVSVFQTDFLPFYRQEYERLFGNEGIVSMFVSPFGGDETSASGRLLRQSLTNVLHNIREQFREGLITGEEAINASFDALAQILGITAEDLALKQ